MAIAFVGVGTHSVTTGSTGTLTYNWPSGYTPTAGHVAFVVQMGNWTQTNWGLHPYGPTPSGYTAYSKNGRDFDATSAVCVSLHYRFLDGSESAPSVSKATTYTSLLHGFVFIFSGVHNSNMTHGGIVKSSSGAATSLTTTSHTTTINNTMSFQVVTQAAQGALYSTSTGVWTDRASGANYDTSTGPDGSAGLATKLMTTAGTVGYITWNSTATAGWAAIKPTIAPASVPDAPTSVTATPNAVKGFALSWNAPGDNGQTITQYTVQWSTDNVSFTTYGTTSSTSLNVTDPGSWADNTLYYFRVKATNSIGDSAYSTSGSGTTWNVPGAPTAMTVGTTTSTTIPLSWTAPASNGGTAVTDYVVQHSTDNSTWTTFTDGTGTGTSTTITGLSPSTLYYLRVAAVNAVGTGSYGTTTATTAPPPAFWGHVSN
jgi:hypothetical protein